MIDVFNLKISIVVISAFNKDFVAHALSSCLAAKDVIGEIILVASVQDSKVATSVLSEWDLTSENSPNVKIIESDCLWPGELRNIGLNEVKFSYCMFLDSDDFLIPASFYKVLYANRKNYFDILVVDYLKLVSGKVHASNYINKLSDFTCNALVCDGKSLIKAPPYCWNKVYRVEFIRNNDLAFSSGMYEDVLWNFRCALNAEVLIIEDLPCVCYRVHDKSLTKNRDVNHFTYFEVYRKCIDYAREVDPSLSDIMLYYLAFRAQALHIYRSGRLLPAQRREWLRCMREFKAYLIRLRHFSHFGLIDVGVYFRFPLLVDVILEFRRFLLFFRK